MLVAIIAGVSFPWVAAITWFVWRSGWWVLDGRAVASQASRFAAFRGRR